MSRIIFFYALCPFYVLKKTQKMCRGKLELLIEFPSRIMARKTYAAEITLIPWITMEPKLTKWGQPVTIANAVNFRAQTS